MGDAPFMTWISLIPLAVIIVTVGLAILAQRSIQQNIRMAAAGLITFFSIVLLIIRTGLLFSIAGGGLIVLVGLIMLVLVFPDRELE